MLGANFKPAKINDNPFAVILNITLGFIRAAICFGMVRIVYVLVYQRVILIPSQFREYGWTAFFEIYLTMFLFLLVNAAIYDTICGGTSVFADGSFEDRIKIGKFIHFIGFSGTYYEIFFARIMIYTLIVLAYQSIDHPTKEFFGLFKEYKLVKGIDKMFKDNVLVCSVLLYTFVTLFWSIMRCFGKYLEHPWISPYARDPVNRKNKNDFNLFTTGLFVFNVSVKALIFTFLVEDVSSQNFFKDYWKLDVMQISSILTIMAIVAFFTFREVYLIFRLNRSASIKSVFFFDGLVFVYLISLVNVLTQRVNYVYLYVILIFMLVNFVAFVITEARRSLNVAVFLAGKISSSGFLTAFGVYVFLVASILAMNLSFKHEKEDKFIPYLNFMPVLKALIDFAKQLQDLVKSVLGFLQKLFYFAFSPTASLAVCIAVIVAIVVCIAVSVLPFGIGSFGVVVMTIVRITRAFRKLAKVLARLLSNMKSIKRFAGKITSMSDMKPNPIGDFLGVILVLLGGVSKITGVVAISLAFWERTTDISHISYMAFGICGIGLNVAYMTIMLIICLIICREFNLGIVYVGFKPTRYFTMMIIEKVICILALIGLIFAIMFSTKIDEHETKELAKKLKVKTEIKKKKKIKLQSGTEKGEHPEIIYENSEGREVVYDTYLLKDWCNAVCPCRKPTSMETPLQICGVICKTFWPCLKTDDKRTVGKYPMSKAFPCQHPNDLEREDYFRKNKPCNCIFFECECDCNNAENYCFKINSIGKLATDNVTVVLIALGFYMAYISVGKIWYKVDTNLGALLSSIIGDTGPKANSNAYDAQSNDQNSMCQGTVQMIIKAFLGPIFKVIFETVPGFKKMTDALKAAQEAQQASPATIIFNSGAKLVIIVPLGLAGILLLLFSFASEITTTLLKPAGIAIALALSFSGLYTVITLPLKVNAIFYAIRIIEVKVGYQDCIHILIAFLLIIIACIFTIVDTIAPPNPAQRPMNFDEQIDLADEEVRDPMHMNQLLDEAVDVFAGKKNKIRRFDL